MSSRKKKLESSLEHLFSRSKSHSEDVLPAIEPELAEHMAREPEPEAQPEPVKPAEAAPAVQTPELPAAPFIHPLAPAVQPLPPEPPPQPAPAAPAAHEDTKPAPAAPAAPAATQPSKPESKKEEKTDQQVVTFLLGNTHFGVDILIVQSIIKIPRVYPVPLTPKHVRGLINLRGQIVPIMDMHRKLGLPGGDEENESQRILILEVSGEMAGVLVDAVTGVNTLPSDIIEEMPPIAAPISREYIMGVARVDEKLIVLLDVEKALKT
ncbi:MAG TPA: chemotaxis protein CheW [Anaerolineaceae bacterium]|nr:chemotaxis protein CheW [Anaerolineaceae bacterium]HPN51606.1 chemotaxis protein CheW [Anaerolineaceae bacterium]